MKITKDNEEGMSQQHLDPTCGKKFCEKRQLFVKGPDVPRVGVGTLVTWDTVGLRCCQVTALDFAPENGAEVLR